MKRILTIVVFLTAFAAYGQTTLTVDSNGKKLQRFYLAMDVENLWIAGHHVTWDTGQPDMPESKHGNKTHCSAFAAAACKRAGIYLLCPPELGKYYWLMPSTIGCKAR